MWRKRNTHALLVGMQTGAATVENSMEIPEKVTNRTTLQSSNLTLGIYPKNTKTLTQRDTCTPIFTAALFTIAKTRKQPKCPLTDEWIKKTCYIYVCVYIYIMEYYSAKKKE